ncbi:hypothetical protein DFH07DRAFT_1000830 [Mycena maculata]|uniref:F-box domain-containing protein n=1 Tax=Mycena maculata TaxID=230809 RepID=A0AAD7MPV3_9AGAR|nr:hypothetical protein DFH07DRAFT_1000830 [Mycena maculata]
MSSLYHGLYKSWYPMGRIGESIIDSLPDEVLAAILKLVADMPVPSWNRTPPFPVAASRVNRRWHAVALGSPELWTNIRISHRSRSWQWAAVFVQRSRSHLLDISVNLESYVYQTYPSCRQRKRRPVYPADISMSKVLAVLGPHVGRWRSIALRGWRGQVHEFCDFLRKSRGAAHWVEAAHLSCLDYIQLPPLAELFGVEHFHSLMLNAGRSLAASLRTSALHSLDIDLLNIVFFDYEKFGQLFGPTSTLRTLVIRNFYPTPISLPHPIDASTIRSFAVSFSVPFYYEGYWDHGYTSSRGFDTLTDVFNLPNLDQLELMGGFTGLDVEDDAIHLPAPWESPLFPHLRTLRLEEVGFGRTGLALIHSFGPGITALELIYTTRNEHLLAADMQWPALRALTIEAQDGLSAPAWLAAFVALRAAHDMPITALTLRLSPANHALILMLEPAPTICWLWDGPSPALLDNVSHRGFYVDDVDGHVTDFEHVDGPCGCSCGCEDEYSDCNWREWNLEQDAERLDKEIDEHWKIAGDLARRKGLWREMRKVRRGDFKELKANKRKLKGPRRSSRDLPYELSLDYWVMPS